MKMLATIAKPVYTVEFESHVVDHPSPYGSGKAMEVSRNGEPFYFLDCRYASDFTEAKFLQDFLRDFYGENLISLKLLD